MLACEKGKAAKWSSLRKKPAEGDHLAQITCIICKFLSAWSGNFTVAALAIFNNLQHFYLPQTFDHQTGSDLIDAVIIFLVMMKYFSFIYLLLFAIPVTFGE